jgi:hypothetical protein
MTELQKVQDQLNKALAELMKVNLDENELLYDYIFEAHRLVKKLTIPVVVKSSCGCNAPRYVNKGDVLRCTKCDKFICEY